MSGRRTTPNALVSDRRGAMLDVDRLLEESGILALSCLSQAPDVASSVRALALAAMQLDEVSRAQIKSIAGKTLSANQVDGGREAVNAAFKETAARRPGNRGITTASTVALAEKLPDGVVPNTDLANAHRLLRDHGSDLRFVDSIGWLVWNDTRWKRDSSAAARRAHAVACSVERTSAMLQAEAAHLESQGHGEESAKYRAAARLYREWAEESQQARRISACLKIAESLEGICIGDESLDTDPMLFTCANGTIDLRTGTLREHRREDMITRASPVLFDPAASAATWEHFQREVHPDAAIRDFNQRHYGYSLTGIVSEHVLIVCYGGGGNGKSTETEAIRHVFGDYALEAATGTFVESKQGRSSDNKLASLRAARMVTTSESGEGNKLNETLVKRATGGDELTANFLYKETFRFHPQFKLRLITNHRPELTGVDEGIWRRLRLVPYTVDFGGRKDLQLPSRLREEASGILAWLVRGCLEWQRNGLHPPKLVEACTEEWRSESNVVGQFVADRCTTLPGAKVKAGTLYAAYVNWSRDQGTEAMAQVAFGKRLAALGYVQARSNRDGRLWTGIGLLLGSDHYGSMSHDAS